MFSTGIVAAATAASSGDQVAVVRAGKIELTLEEALEVTRNDRSVPHTHRAAVGLARRDQRRQLAGRDVAARLLALAGNALDAGHPRRLRHDFLALP
jgi:hypothetical protein